MVPVEGCWHVQFNPAALLCQCVSPHSDRTAANGPEPSCSNPSTPLAGSACTVSCTAYLHGWQGQQSHLCALRIAMKVAWSSGCHPSVAPCRARKASQASTSGSNPPVLLLLLFAAAWTPLLLLLPLV